MESDTHKKLKAVAMQFGKKLVTDLVCREVKFKNLKSVADVVAINIKRKEIRIFEAKATRADYIRDKKLFNIDESYYYHCHYFYIICPRETIQLEDVPKEYGLLWVDFENDNEIEIMRKPTKNNKRLKTMFDTTYKNSIKTVTNDLFYHYIVKDFNLHVNEYKRKRKRKRRK